MISMWQHANFGGSFMQFCLFFAIRQVVSIAKLLLAMVYYWFIGFMNVYNLRLISKAGSSFRLLSTILY